MPSEIHYKNQEELAANLAQSILDDLENLLVLPGGTSPRLLITELAKLDFNWSGITISTTDERCVPLDSEDSNAGQIERLFSAQDIDIKVQNLLDSKDIEPADVMVLGMGPDGHIASLFPGMKLDDPDQAIIKVQAPKPPPDRVSLTLPTLLKAKRLILLVIGAEKWDLCQGILAGKNQDLPVAQLMAQAGERLEMHIVKE